MISIYIRIGFRSLSTLDTHSEVVFDLNLNELTKTKGKSINEDNSDFLWSVGWISERYTNQDSSYNLPGRWSDKLLISLLESVHKAGLPLKIWKDKQLVYSLIRGVLVNTILWKPVWYHPTKNYNNENIQKSFQWRLVYSKLHGAPIRSEILW